MPAVRPFDDPTSWLLPANGAGKRRFTASANMRNDTTCSSFLFWFVVIVALIEAEVLRTSWAARGSDVHSIQCFTNHVHVVHVGTRQSNCEWNSLAIDEDVPLRAELCAIGGIGTREVPPFGALTLALSREAQSHSRPILPS